MSIMMEQVENLSRNRNHKKELNGNSKTDYLK